MGDAIEIQSLIYEEKESVKLESTVQAWLMNATDYDFSRKVNRYKSKGEILVKDLFLSNYKSCININDKEVLESYDLEKYSQYLTKKKLGDMLKTAPNISNISVCDVPVRGIDEVDEDNFAVTDETLIVSQHDTYGEIFPANETESQVVKADLLGIEIDQDLTIPQYNREAMSFQEGGKPDMPSSSKKAFTVLSGNSEQSGLAQKVKQNFLLQHRAKLTLTALAIILSTGIIASVYVGYIKPTVMVGKASSNIASAAVLTLFSVILISSVVLIGVLYFATDNKDNKISQTINEAHVDSNIQVSR